MKMPLASANSFTLRRGGMVALATDHPRLVGEVVISIAGVKRIGVGRVVQDGKSIRGAVSKAVAALDAGGEGGIDEARVLLGRWGRAISSVAQCCQRRR